MHLVFIELATQMSLRTRKSVRLETKVFGKTILKDVANLQH